MVLLASVMSAMAADCRLQCCTTLLCAPVHLLTISEQTSFVTDVQMNRSRTWIKTSRGRVMISGPYHATFTFHYRIELTDFI